LIEIGKKIKKIRIEKGMNQQELSKLTGITQADISRIERGFTNFKIITLLKILKILNIDKFEI
jgi:transcriptional regulator with XRE-family HTH domain